MRGKQVIYFNRFFCLCLYILFARIKIIHFVSFTYVLWVVNFCTKYLFIIYINIYFIVIPLSYSKIIKKGNLFHVEI